MPQLHAASQANQGQPANRWLVRKRLRNSFRRALLSTGILGALSASALAQQPPSMPTLPSYQQPAYHQPSGLPQQAYVQPNPALNANAGRLQVYAVPSEFVGTVGAQLQIQYHNQPNVKVTTDPKTGQLMVMAPDAVHQQIGAQVAAFMKQNNIAPGDRGMNVASRQQQTYALKHLSWRELEDAIQRLAGPKLSITAERNGELAIFRMPNATSGMEDILQIDRRLNQVTLLGSGPSVAGWTQVVFSLDMGQADAINTTHIVPTAPAEPRRIRQAIQLVKATIQDQSGGQAGGGQAEARIDVDGDEQATAVSSLDDLSSESGLFGDVQIEFVDDLGLVIIRGAKRDVQRTLEVIEKIKNSAIETQPDVVVYQLEHANAQAVATLVTELYENIFEPRQGTVSITALGQPNALLLIGRTEVIASVKELVAKIDQPLDAANQLKVIHLLHASATDVEARIREFFVEKPGGNEDDREGLGTRVKVLADYRTNSLIVQAAPREMAEVQELIDKLDVESTQAENEVRVFRLKNTLSDDLVEVIQEVITGAAQGADTTLATPPSGKLTITTLDNGKKVQSGILAGVVITSDPSVNALVVRAPAESMSLIEELIGQLDSLPSAEARIKVFQLQNGDATSLAQTLQALFGLPVTAGQSPGNNLLTSLSQQSALTTGGEGSLVQLQIAADARTNSIVVSGSSSDLEVFEVLLLRLDEDVKAARRSEVVWLRNAEALAVATAISDYFGQQAQANSQLSANQILSPSQLVAQQVFVVPEEATNSILISATSRFMDDALRLIERLDRRPPLVCIQFLIAEVQLDDDFEFGTELGIQDGLLFDRGSATGGTLGSPVFNTGTTLTGPSSAVNPAFLSQNVAGQALSGFGVGRSSAAGPAGLVLSASSEAVGVLVRALQTSNRLQILNRPQITTLDQREAQSLVGSQVPRVTNVSAAALGTPQQVTTQDTQVGLSLSVLPRVNQDGLILMRVRVVNSSVGDPNTGIPIGFGANGEVIRSPIINETSADTTVSAYSGQTVVFAGLISKTRGSSRSQIPILGSLPLIGPAFRFDTESESRRELMVVMTPRIIQTDEDYEVLKQVETSRMSWCLADVLNVHGDVGLSGGNGLWGPAKSPVIYPDIQPAVLEDRTRPYNQGPDYGAGIPVPGMIEESYPAPGGYFDEPAVAPALDTSATNQRPSPFRTVSFPQQPQQAVTVSGQSAAPQNTAQQGVYR
ncbi:MAG: secretin N-terminal domain-containing protein [Pirellulaceae bacterium]